MGKTYAMPNPAGTISFAGSVPIDLAFSGADDQFAADCRLSGPRIAILAAARRGTLVSERVYQTLEQAIEAGRALGVDVVPVP